MKKRTSILVAVGKNLYVYRDLRGWESDTKINSKREGMAANGWYNFVKLQSDYIISG